MEIYKEIKFDRIVAKLKLNPNTQINPNLHAIGELQFIESGQAEPLIKSKGWTIRTKEFGDKKVLTVVPPAYPSGKNRVTGKQILKCSFFIDNKDFYKEIVNLFLEEYAQLTGGLSAEESEMSDMDRVAEEVFPE